MSAQPETGPKKRWQRVSLRAQAAWAGLFGWTAGWLGEPGARFLFDLLATPLFYLREIIWENDQAYGFALLRGLWTGGWLGRLALAALSAGLLVTAALIAAPGAQPAPAILPAALALYILGWAFAVAAANRASLFVFSLASAYLLYYGVLLGGGLAGTFAFGLPAFWALFLGWRIASAAAGRTRFAWFLLLCLICANMAYGALGLNRFLPVSFNPIGRPLLGLLIFLVLSIPLLRTKKIAPLPDEAVFAGSLGVFALFIILAVRRDPLLIQENALLTLRSLLGLVDLAWFWLGWTLFEAALDLGSWLSARIAGLVPEKISGFLFPTTWALSAAFCWLAVHEVPLYLAVAAYSIGLQQWAAGISAELYFTLYDFLFAALGVLSLAALFGIARRWSLPRLYFLNGLWIAAFLALLTYYSSMTAFATLEEDASAPLGLWTGLLLVGGIVWELARSSAAYLEPETRPRLFAMSAGLILFLSLSVYTLGQRLPDMILEYTTYSFLGAVYLGAPLALFAIISELTGYEGVPGIRLLALFGIGILSAVLVMGIEYNAGPHLALAAPCWAAALWLLGRPLARLESPQDGVAAGGALALGFAVYWMSPQLLPAPFLAPLLEWQLRYLNLPLNRPLLQPVQALFTALSLASGIALGLAFTRRRRWLWLAAALPAAALTLGLLLPALPGIP